MITRDPVLPPEFIYPIDYWRLVQSKFSDDYVGQQETLFTTSNGYLGMRGGFEEGRPVHQHGTFINGFYESWPIPYGESAHGFARTGQTIVNVPDCKIIRLYVNDEPFTLPTANIIQFERSLDMRSGTLDREVLWERASGKRIRVKSRRLVSYKERHLAAISYEITVLDSRIPVAISSEIVDHTLELDDNHRHGKDPRLARTLHQQVLVPKVHYGNDKRVVLGYQTRRSKMTMACGIDHLLETECEYISKCISTENGGQVVYTIDAEPGKPILLTKFITYHTSKTAPAEELCARTERTLDRAVTHGFNQLLAGQKVSLNDFWCRSDIEIESKHPRFQQSLRWNLFQLFQATVRADDHGIPAKGLTGQAYEGHYFWDMEIYVLPFLIYTQPRIAKNLLKFRYNMLDKARQRAREVNQKGAMFPWRTINGEEASAYYAAGTAQYHINADIMHALKKYVDITGDREFLHQFGAEMLVETARLWYDLGFFSERRGGAFCIHGVTGPDEYTTVVNNNTFTNLMARENLRFAVKAVREMQEQHPQHLNSLVHNTHLDLQEVDNWHRAAENMYVPFDDRLGIHPQDDTFLEKNKWDFESNVDKYPLLLHYHPLVIYRHQVIKQADVVLALFLCGKDFTLEEKKQDFDYYDPLTTGDSSLSACIQSIVAAEIGYDQKAIEYLRYALLMDLADVGGNVIDGCHIASIGGTWMALVYGFAGMRDYNGEISFDPKQHLLPKLKFQLRIQGQLLEIDITKDAVRYELLEGTELKLKHRGQEVRLWTGTPVTM